MTTRSKNKRSKKRHFKVLKTILLVILSLILITSVALGGLALGIIKTAPPLNVNKLMAVNETSKLYDDKNKYMDKVITQEKIIPASFDTIPENLKNAFVSIEDERFYKHNGIDPKRIAGAFFVDIKNKIKREPGLQGASTITQQLLKIKLLGSGDTFLEKVQRKIREAYLAMKLEKLLSKEQILEAYLNSIFLGNNARGVGAAAEQYFSKDIKDLNLLQCAYIAGVTQSPSINNAFSLASKKNPSIYLNRTKTVLYKMHHNGYISEQEYSKAVDDLNNGKLTFKRPKSIDRMNYEWFSREVTEQVKKDLKKQYGYNDNEVDSLLLYGGLHIYTTMNKAMQDSTQNILNNMHKTLGINQTEINGIIQPQASAVIINYHTGEVKAMVGGRGTQPPLSLNRAFSGKNACGSNIKPLTVYAPGIDTGIITAATIIDDNPLPLALQEKYGSGGVPYNPKNSPNVYAGPITVREGLKQSKNVVSIQIEDLISIKTGAAYGEKFGLPLTKTEKSSIAALGLGEISGTNSLTVAAAFGVFGNNGMYSSPRLYTKVVDKSGRVILESKYKSHKVISPQAAYIMYDLLRGPLEAGGTGYRGNFSPMARGKTGTSTGSKNVWFSGLTPYYSASLWIGDDKNRNFNDYNNYLFGRYIGSNDAAAIWGQIMSAAHNGLEVKSIPKPSGISEVSICTKSGKIATPNCIQQGSAKTEFFINGTEPTEYCDVHTSSGKSDEDEEDEEDDENIDEDEQKNDDTKKDKKKTDKKKTNDSEDNLMDNLKNMFNDENKNNKHTTETNNTDSSTNNSNTDNSTNHNNSASD